MDTKIELTDWPFKNKAPLETGAVGDIIWALAEAPRYGAINGYVYVPRQHPWLAVDEPMWDLSVEVHGGITFAEGRWFGFDVTHAWDWWPGMAGEKWTTRYPDMVERDIHYVRAEAIHLAEQAQAVVDGGTYEI